MATWMTLAGRSDDDPDEHPLRATPVATTTAPAMAVVNHALRFFISTPLESFGNITESDYTLEEYDISNFGSRAESKAGAPARLRGYAKDGQDHTQGERAARVHRLELDLN